MVWTWLNILVSRRRGALAWMACVALVGAPSAASGAEVWEYSPYRVSVWVDIESEGVGDERASDLMQALTERLESMAGASCQWTVAAPPAKFAPWLRYGLDRLPRNALPADMAQQLSGGKPLDKVILLAVSRDRQGVRVAARQWDATVGLWGPVIVRRARQHNALGAIALQAAWAAFAPLARIDRITLESGRQTATVGVRGGALAPDGSPLVQAGAALAIGQLQGSPAKPAGVSPLEWTWLWVEKVDGAQATCQVLSPHRSSLPAGDAPPLLAWRVTAPGGGTRVRLQSPGEPPKALAGYEVWRYAPGAARAERLATSDESGFVVAPPVQESLSVLVVKSGSQAVARLPLVPGVQPMLVATLSVDRDWLRAQARLEELDEQLLELVARRQMEAARIRRRIAGQQYAEVEPLLVRLRDGTTLERFSQTLADEQKRIFSADVETQRAIDGLFDQTRQAAEQYLGPSLVEALTGELAKAQGIEIPAADALPAEPAAQESPETAPPTPPPAVADPPATAPAATSPATPSQ